MKREPKPDSPAWNHKWYWAAVKFAVVGMVLWVWGVVLWITAENWWGWASMAAGLLLYRESWYIAGNIYARRKGRAVR